MINYYFIYNQEPWRGIWYVYTLKDGDIHPEKCFSPRSKDKAEKYLAYMQKYCKSAKNYEELSEIEEIIRKSLDIKEELLEKKLVLLKLGT